MTEPTLEEIHATVATWSEVDQEEFRDAVEWLETQDWPADAIVRKAWEMVWPLVRGEGSPTSPPAAR